MSSRLTKTKQFVKIAITAVLSIGLAIAGATTSNADVATLVTTDDGDVITFGGNIVDTVAPRLNLFQSGGNVKNVILEFDLGSLSVGDTVNSATLNLVKDGNISNIGGNPAPIEVYGYAGDGVVDIADYNATALALLLGPEEIPFGTANGTSFNFSLSTGLIQTIVDSSGLLTLRLETNSFATVDFASLETATGFAPPSLTLDFTPTPTPEPSALVLLTAMTAGIWVKRRRR